MKQATAEDVLKVVEGLKDEENRRVVISVDHFGWQVDIEDKCHNLRTHETFWKPVASQTSATFIEALDMVVGGGERGIRSKVKGWPPATTPGEVTKPWPPALNSETSPQY